MRKKLVSALLVLALVIALVPSAIFAADKPALFSEFLTTGKISAPGTPYIRVFVDDSRTWGDELQLWTMLPNEIRQIAAAGEKWNKDNPNGENMLHNRFGVESLDFYIQTDARVDGGSWQYTSAWDSPETFWSIGDMAYDTYRAEGDVAWNNALFDERLCELDNDDAKEGFLGKMLTSYVNEYGDTRYQFDLKNHTLGVRCRIMMRYIDQNDGQVKTLISPWSAETSIGKNGNQKSLAAPNGIEAPTLSQFALNVHMDSGESVYADYFITIPTSVYNGILYCVAEKNMFEPYEIETQIRVDGGQWTEFTIGNGTWIFDGLRGGGPSSDYQFTKDSKIEIRARIINDLGQVSAWSNIVGNNATFTSSEWATPYLNTANEMGIIPDELADADLKQPITRQEFAKVAVKLYESLSGKTAAAYTGKPFSDTTDADVLKAFDLNLIDGYRNDNQPRTDVVKFGPNDLLTREQMCAILARCYKKVNFSGWTLQTDGNFDAQFAAAYTRKPITLDNGAKINAFTDEKDISGWAMDSVYFLVSIDALNGLGDGTFGPRNLTPEQEARKACNATREQALKVAVCMAQAFAR